MEQIPSAQLVYILNHLNQVHTLHSISLGFVLFTVITATFRSSKLSSTFRLADKILYPILNSPNRATCPANFMLTVTILGEVRKL